MPKTPSPVHVDIVEKLRLIEVRGAGSLLLGGGDSVDDGRTEGDAGGAVLRLQPRAACSGQSPASQDRPVCRPFGGPDASGAVLQRDGSPFDRSRADDADADCWLLLWHSLGASAVRRGPPQFGVSLVLSVGARRRGSRSFDLFQEPPRPFARKRPPAQAVRDRGGALHQGTDRGRRSFRS